MESPISMQNHSVAARIISTESLMSMERLDRSSPELWPEQIPGMQDYPPRARQYKSPDWMGDFNTEDLKLYCGLSKMPPASLVTEVKKLYDAAYQLGREESREMTRGKYLKVLTKPSKAEGGGKVT